MINVYKALYEIEKTRGNEKKALKFHERWISIRDSILSEENRLTIQLMEADYESERQQQEIERQEIELAKVAAETKVQQARNIALGSGLIVLIIIVLLIYRSYRIKSNANKILEKNNELITDQKSFIERQAEQLREINQGKDKLFSIISHDLRAPLNSLHGMLNLMDAGKLSKTELEKMLDSLNRNFDHTSGFLDNLLNWSKSQLGGTNVSRTSFNLKELLDSLAQLFDEKLKEKELQLNVEVPSDYMMKADFNLIQLVLRNLLANAIKFSYANSKIELRATADFTSYIIEIEDHGVGMTDAQKAELFKFEMHSTRGTKNELGSGLGLILCQEFVGMHSGSIEVRSEESKGSTFTVRLPKEA